MPHADVALVTGAGAGAGREYVRLLLADGYRVLAVSLLDEELQALADDLDPGDGRLVTQQADLCEQHAAEKLMAWCDSQGHQVDILINNAGFAAYGAPCEIDLSKVERMLMLNVVTSTKLSMLFGERMKQRGRGRILMMGSSAGFSPTVKFAAYGASKGFINTFAVALGAELKHYGVQVTNVAPGSFQSKFAATADIAGYRGSSLMKRIYETEKLDARAVAEAGYRALMGGKPTVTVGAKAAAAKVMARVFSPVFLARCSRVL
ncbi:short-chain dehydrogenase [Mycobacterium saskatchewanense]|uniref:Short-chain dehydrogenase n=1 Tax=Mycobacterium saskatchewanense TaxID=220927 RepID=A0AAJ3NTT6_9MYCO|nr:SDR family NAD(P)-dependent oxidoreductase [Mycobacterium saskatchewanense]ORW73720.1 hypothetical protein AWC23_06465 [Mycobacterium saskatchewanense]BBX65184.1 short-chain dehydrogenase [Mycobacterium saskatchewanense]